MDIATDDQRVIRTYKGNGDGTLTAGPTYPTIGDGGFIHATDLDGDGNVDIWSGYAGDLIYMGSMVSTGYALMGNGNGTFQGAPNLPFAYSGENAADLTGNGRVDYVGVTGQGVTPTIQTYLTGANGIPVAGPSQAAPLNSNPQSPVLADFTGDKIQDLFFVGGNVGAETFYVGVGKGDGSFQTPTATPAPSLVPSGVDGAETIFNVYAADMNHDGKMDIVYSFYDIDGVAGTYVEGIAVQLGTGSGTFGAPKIVYTYQSKSAPQFFESNQIYAVQDVNGDNFPDIFTVTPTGIVNGNPTYLTQIYLGVGDGTLKAPATLTVTPSFQSSLQAPFAFADINGDGKLDMITSGANADVTESQIAINLGNGDGTFKAPTLLTVEGIGNSGSPVVADLDGDGKLDLALGGVYGLGGTIFIGNGDGTFQTMDNGDGTVTGGYSIALQLNGPGLATDVNGDGKPDLVFGSVVLVNKFGSVPPVLASTTTTVTATPNPSTQGANVTLTATVISATAGTITGTVTFYDGATTLGTGTLNGSGMATYSTTALAQGSHTITAQYSGDTVYGGSASPVVTQVVNAGTGAATTTALTAQPNPTTVNSPVTLQVTVTSKTAGTITGSVTFFDGSTNLGTRNLSSQGTALFTFAPTTQGSHSFTAVYGGDANYTGSTSPAAAVAVNPTGSAATTSLLKSSPNPSTVGATVTYTPSVSSTTAGTITGWIQIFDGTQQVAEFNSNGTLPFTFFTTYNTPGTHMLTAKYLGNATYAPSTSPVLTQVVNAAGTAATTTTLTTSPNPAATGATVTLTAKVTSTTAGTITGTVSFMDGMIPLGAPVTLSGGVAMTTKQFAGGGTHTITAVYGGDATYATSTSPAVAQVINASGTAATTTAVTSSLNPSPAGANVTFTATVTSTTAGTVTGTVAFYSGSSNLGSAAVGTGGVANFTTHAFSGGQNAITAHYGGNATFAASTSPVLQQEVDVAATATTLTADPTTAASGASVAFTATVTATGTNSKKSQAAPVVTGTVQLMEGVGLIGTPVNVGAGGVATASVSTLSPGTHMITAAYSGDANYAPSTSTAVTVTITGGGTYTVALSPTAGDGDVGRVGDDDGERDAGGRIRSAGGVFVRWADAFVHVCVCAGDGDAEWDGGGDDDADGFLQCDGDGCEARGRWVWWRRRGFCARAGGGIFAAWIVCDAAAEVRARRWNACGVCGAGRSDRDYGDGGLRQRRRFVADNDHDHGECDVGGDDGFGAVDGDGDHEVKVCGSFRA